MHRGGFKIDVTGGTYILDDAAEKTVDCQVVNYLFMPVPSSGSRSSQGSVANQVSNAADPGGGNKKTGVKKNGKPKGKDKGKGKGRDTSSQRMPPGLEGCRATTNKGEAICFNYNLPGGCSRTVTKGRCEKGLHACAKIGCGKMHSLQSHE